MPETIEIHHRRAPLAPESLDRQRRTVEVTFSTGAAVTRRDFQGPFQERLSLAPEAVDLSRFVGGPVLDSHRQDSLDRVLGVVVRARVDGRRGYATVRFSERPAAEALMRDIEAGIVRGVSIGYAVERWDDAEDPATGTRTRTATRWAPIELSFVAMPADAGATVRTMEGAMPEDVTTTAPAAVPPQPENTRAAVNTEIRSIARVAGLEADFADGLIDRGASVEEARAAAFEALAERSAQTRVDTTQPRVEIGRSFDDPETRAAWMGEALYARNDPGHQLSEPARRYAAMPVAEMARETLRLRGLSTTGLSQAALIGRALDGAGMHGTSDFALIVGDSVNRTLRAAYEAAPAGVRQMGRRTSARDFRAKHRIQLGEAPSLEKVNEHGEFKSGSMAEAAESYRIDTFGRVFGITRQALVNDDLGAFSDLARRLGIAAAEFEAQFLVDLLEVNAGLGPTMEDGKSLFHADHGNLHDDGTNGASTWPDAGYLSMARLAMRKQTGLSGQRISVVPRNFLVPADLETEAEKLLTAVQAARTADVNPFAGLNLVVEPRLSNASAFYLQAENVDGLEYAYLEGAEGPQIESRSGFEVDGVQIRVRLDFGAGFVDWRGWYHHTGSQE